MMSGMSESASKPASPTRSEPAASRPRLPKPPPKYPPKDCLNRVIQDGLARQKDRLQDVNLRPSVMPPAKIGIGARAGAAIGAILDGKKGAAAGAAVGGGVGTAVVLGTKGTDVRLASGADVTTRLTAPLKVRVP